MLIIFKVEPENRQSMIQNPLKALFGEISPEELSETVFAVMIDYAIASVKDDQLQSTDEAVDNIINMKRLRDALYQTSKSSGNPFDHI